MFLLNKLEVNGQYPVAIMPITREELDRYNYKDGDLEGWSIFRSLFTMSVYRYKSRNAGKG